MINTVAVEANREDICVGFKGVVNLFTKSAEKSDIGTVENTNMRIARQIGVHDCLKLCSRMFVIDDVEDAGSDFKLTATYFGLIWGKMCIHSMFRV